MSGPPRVEQAVDLAEELATVSQKYEMNVNKLKRQKVRLTKHVEKLILFMEVHREIEKWLEGMSETISGLLPISEDSDEAKAQLANTKGLNDEFQKYRAKLDVLEEITDFLIVAEKDDPTLVAELREKFSAVEEPFERLHSVVLQRQARLQNIVINSQDFQLSLSEAQNNLNEFERSVAQLEPISAIYEVVQRQKEDHEVIMN